MPTRRKSNKNKVKSRRRKSAKSKSKSRRRKESPHRKSSNLQYKSKVKSKRRKSKGKLSRRRKSSKMHQSRPTSFIDAVSVFSLQNIYGDLDLTKLSRKDSNSLHPVASSSTTTQPPWASVNLVTTSVAIEDMLARSRNLSGYIRDFPELPPELQEKIYNYNIIPQFYDIADKLYPGYFEYNNAEILLETARKKLFKYTDGDEKWSFDKWYTGGVLVKIQPEYALIQKYIEDKNIRTGDILWVGTLRNQLDTSGQGWANTKMGFVLVDRNTTIISHDLYFAKFEGLNLTNIQTILTSIEKFISNFNNYNKPLYNELRYKNYDFAAKKIYLFTKDVKLQFL